MENLNYYQRLRVWRDQNSVNWSRHENFTAHYSFPGSLTGSIRQIVVRDLGGFNLSFYHPPLISKRRCTCDCMHNPICAACSGGACFFGWVSNVGRDTASVTILNTVKSEGGHGR